jgi:hypothetical protein
MEQDAPNWFKNSTSSTHKSKNNNIDQNFQNLKNGPEPDQTDIYSSNNNKPSMTYGVITPWDHIMGATIANFYVRCLQRNTISEQIEKIKQTENGQNNHSFQTNLNFISPNQTNDLESLYYHVYNPDLTTVILPLPGTPFSPSSRIQNDPQKTSPIPNSSPPRHGSFTLHNASGAIGPDMLTTALDLVPSILGSNPSLLRTFLQSGVIPLWLH